MAAKREITWSQAAEVFDNKETEIELRALHHDEVRKISVSLDPCGVFVNGFRLLHDGVHLHRGLGWVAELSWLFERSNFHFLALSLPFVFLRVRSH